MWMKLGVAVVVVVLLAVATLGKAHTAVEREFVSGGTVRLNLEAGDYTVLASKDDRIRVTVDDAPRGADVQVDVDVQGSQATVSTDTPWNEGPKIRIELPRRTNIVLDLSAGELAINGIEGSKDVSARAGEVSIGVGPREQYRYVTASVRIGELKAHAFNVSKDGFFRSFEWTGDGQYDLRAHLTVGELNLAP